MLARLLRDARPPHRRSTVAPHQAIGARFGISHVRVFGSVAHGTAGAHSDLGLLVDVAPGHGYFDLTGFALEVEDLLGVFTQVATVNGLQQRLRDRVLAEALPI